MQIMKNVSCEYDRWVVKTHFFCSCVIRQTRSLGALVLCSICNTRIVFVNYIYDMVVDTQFHKLHGKAVRAWSICFPHEIYIGR